MSFPLWLRIGPFSFSVTGALALIGLFIGSFALYRKSKEEYLPEDTSIDMLVLSTVSALVGGRAVFGIVEGFGWNLFSYVRVFSHPGIFWWGMVMAAIIAVYTSLQKTKVDFFKLADSGIFAAIWVQGAAALGRLIDGSALRYLTASELAGYVILYLLLSRISHNYRTYDWYKGKKGDARPGFVFLIYLAIMSILRLATLWWRFPPGPLRLAELIFSGLFLVGSLLCLYIRSGSYAADQGKAHTEASVLKVRRPPVSARRHLKAGRDAR